MADDPGLFHRPEIGRKGRGVYAFLGVAMLAISALLVFQQDRSGAEIVTAVAFLVLGARVVAGAILGRVPGWLQGVLSDLPIV